MDIPFSEPLPARAHLEMRKTLIREVILVVCILYNHDLAISRREIRIYKQ